ncbi:MAG TPA: SAM-dependent methyltransferase [Burkholderiaceae bacterium]|nr:SAM-dependent methyltransferase [Burkholderiaceae bacterium]
MSGPPDGPGPAAGPGPREPGPATAAAPDPREPGPATTAAPGTLYLIPTPLGEHTSPADSLPAPAIAIAARLDCFVAENARSARQFLKGLPSAHPLQSIEIRELNEHSRTEDLPALLAPLRAGRDCGLLSEAGCPAIADPGAALVALAHRHGVPVMPLVGPSSLTLALMASGLNGQRFAFAGYAPVKDGERDAFLRELEQRSARFGETQMLIETPYRAQALLDALIRVLRPDTDLVMASELTQPTQAISRRTVAQWRASPQAIGKVPAVFALLAAAIQARSPGPPGRHPGAAGTPLAGRRGGPASRPPARRRP